MIEARIMNYHFSPQKIKIDKESIELPELKPDYVDLCGSTLELNDKDEGVWSKPRKITCKQQPDPTKGETWDTPDINSILAPD